MSQRQPGSLVQSIRLVQLQKLVNFRFDVSACEYRPLHLNLHTNREPIHSDPGHVSVSFSLASRPFPLARSTFLQLSLARANSAAGSS